MKTLKPIQLNGKDFAPYGDLIMTQNSESIIINNGYAQKHYNLCTLDALHNNGKSTLHIYVAKKRAFPMDINMLEKHPFFSQAFIPRSTKAFLIVVCLGEDRPDLSTLKAFKTDGNQGVHYKRGVWHFPLISIEDNEQFIVIDRTDCGIVENKIEECIEFYFKNENISLLKE
jgi:ureidoglycolate lyase